MTITSHETRSNKNNREAHLDYLRHLKESVETIRDIIEEAKVAEVVATACYTKNRSLIHTCHNKTPYELVHNKKPDLTFFRVFGALCYPTNDSEDLRKLQPTADIRIFIGYAPSRKGYRTYNKRTRRIMEIIHVQIDELTEPMAPVHLSIRLGPIFLMPGQIIQAPVNSASTPSSTTIDQDAPSPSISPSSSALLSHSLHQGVTAESTFMKDNPVAPVENNPFINLFALEPSSDALASGDDSSRVDAKPSTNNEDKVLNPGILIQEKPFEIITRVVQDKKLATSNASLVLKDFDPPFYEPFFFKEVPRSKRILLFSSKNEEKVFKPGIHTSEKVHSSRIPELSQQGYKVFKINQIFKSPMKIFLFFCGKDTHILAVSCLHFYPIDQFKYVGIRLS
nr:integrase, catalytic region, zinc finger, CCHC-type, peptidase aspartic, catalytic [Tanacetum cinerariifolium]